MAGDVTLSLWALQLLVDTAWSCGERVALKRQGERHLVGSVGLAAQQSEAFGRMNDNRQIETDRTADATLGLTRGGSVAGEGQLPSGAAPTADGPAALLVAREQTAFDRLQNLIKKAESEGKNPYAVALGQRGGLKGGKSRAAKLTAEERSKSASRAARVRWDVNYE